jgi:fucose permease
MKNTIGTLALILGGLMLLWLLATMPPGGEPMFYFGYFLPAIFFIGIGIVVLAVPKKSPD